MIDLETLLISIAIASIISATVSWVFTGWLARRQKRARVAETPVEEPRDDTAPIRSGQHASKGRRRDRD